MIPVHRLQYYNNIASKNVCMALVYGDNYCLIRLSRVRLYISIKGNVRITDIGATYKNESRKKCVWLSYGGQRRIDSYKWINTKVHVWFLIMSLFKTYILKFKISQL